ncbi:type II secretion system protein GspK [Desulfoluna sp.]|uniref:general secretion pathway protein GspK n=1 Tax=Desulfoluna sp. TaxID=2045199 RepID=UPI002607BB36|nr:type II secretion system protein GspK [Desulfoluna sp.]
MDRDGGFSNERGVVLLATLSMMLALFVLVFEASRHARRELATASSAFIVSELRATAVSGVHVGMAFLAADGKEGGTDTVQETWADEEALGTFISSLTFERGKLDLTLTDELGKVQVNALVQYPDGKQFNPDQKALWDNFFDLVNKSNDDIESLGENVGIINAMKDWLDYGDGDASTGLSGAEDDYYLNLETPYPCGNGPLRHLYEMARIKGIDEELLTREEAGYRLCDLLTVYGAESAQAKDDGETVRRFTYPGKVNINTAELPVLFALMPDTLSDMDKEMAATSMVEYRFDKGEEGFLHPLDGEWYNTCPGCENHGINKKMLRTDSTVFAIMSRAVDDGRYVEIHAVVRRDGEKLTVLSWQETGT